MIMATERKSRKSRPEAPSAPESSDFLRDYSPFRIDTSAPPLEDGPRVPLFYVDDREYTIPERIPARLSIMAIKIAATQGRDAAKWYLVENALTPEAISELTEGEASRRVTREQVRDLFTELGERYFGQAEEDTGK